MLQVTFEVPPNAAQGTLLSIAVPDREQPVKFHVPEGCTAGDRLCLSSEDGQDWCLSVPHLVARLCGAKQLQMEHDALVDDVSRVEADLENAKAHLRNMAGLDASQKKVKFEDDHDVLPDLFAFRRRLRRRERALVLREVEAAAYDHEALRLKGIIELRDDEVVDLKRKLQKNLDEAKQIQVRASENARQNSQVQSTNGAMADLSTLIGFKQSTKGSSAAPRFRLKWKLQPSLESATPGPPNQTEAISSSVICTPGPPNLTEARSSSVGANVLRRSPAQTPLAATRSYSACRIAFEAPNSAHTPRMSPGRSPRAWGTSTLRNLPVLIANAAVPKVPNRSESPGFAVPVHRAPNLEGDQSPGLPLPVSLPVSRAPNSQGSQSPMLAVPRAPHV